MSLTISYQKNYVIVNAIYMDNDNYIKIILSAIASVYFIFSLVILVNNGFPEALSDYGAFGDSFGVLNSLFSALGFSGLVYTLLLQQKQIQTQEKETNEQEKRYNINVYETNLYKLIELYKIVLSEVVIEYNNESYIGRDALQYAIKSIMDNIRSQNTNIYPSEIRTKILSKNVSQDDQKIIDYIHHEHFKIIRAKFITQGRLIQTTRLLFKQLEENCPEDYDITNARDLVMSQLTYVECQYFFLYTLTTKNYESFTKSLAKSILLDKNRKVRIIEIHRRMFEDIWKINLSDGYERQEPMMSKKKRKEVAKNKRHLKFELKRLLDEDKEKLNNTINHTEEVTDKE